MTALLGLSLLAGILTVLAPCVLPLLPVIVGESVTGKPSMRRAVVTILSLAASLFVFTLVLKVSTAFIAVPPYVWTWISGGLLVVFGLVTLFPSLWDRLPFVAAINRSSNKALGTGYTMQSILGDIIVGAALGPVFSSCSPTYFLILATVLPVSFALGLVYLTVYIIGLCAALLAVALLGQKLVVALGLASDPRGWFKRAIGIVFLLVGLAILTGVDKQAESALLSHAGVFDVTRIEQALLTKRADMSGLPEGIKPLGAPLLTAEQKSLQYQLAPELVHPDGYLNTDGQPIRIGQFKGKKVVLVDFWTYSCINCQRTIPYLTEWYRKYKDQGLVIIGVHTPEFAFEHLQANVAAALKQFGIQYPVVLDNEYQTWNAFGNQFWPREYLIDIDGYIVHDHAGEGDYDQTETAIQAALAERAVRLGESTAGIATSTVSVQDPGLQAVQSPETYFGAARNEYLGNGTIGKTGMADFTFPQSTQNNRLYLQGSWDIAREYATASVDARIRYTYTAHDIYLVASAPFPVTITVLRDGVPVSVYAGADVDPKTGTVTVKEDRLYRLVRDNSVGTHTIELIIHGVGLKAYTFTFG